MDSTNEFVEGLETGLPVDEAVEVVDNVEVVEEDDSMLE